MDFTEWLTEEELSGKYQRVHLSTLHGQGLDKTRQETQLLLVESTGDHPRHSSQPSFCDTHYIHVHTEGGSKLKEQSSVAGGLRALVGSQQSPNDGTIQLSTVSMGI